TGGPTTTTRTSPSPRSPGLGPVRVIGIFGEATFEEGSHMALDYHFATRARIWLESMFGANDVSDAEVAEHVAVMRKYHSEVRAGREEPDRVRLEGARRMIRGQFPDADDKTVERLAADHLRQLDGRPG